jgi:hypothetical protein
VSGSVMHACFVSVEFDRSCRAATSSNVVVVVVVVVLVLLGAGQCRKEVALRMDLHSFACPGTRRPSVNLPGYVSRVESRRRDADVCLLCEPVWRCGCGRDALQNSMTSPFLRAVFVGAVLSLSAWLCMHKYGFFFKSFIRT